MSTQLLLGVPLEEFREKVDPGRKFRFAGSDPEDGEKPAAQTPGAATSWRDAFKMPSQMETGEGVKFLIQGFLPVGIIMVGGLSGTGKTWFALSMAKALTTDKKFLNCFGVHESIAVIYMIPESGERAFKSRLGKMGIDQNFYCRTMTDGVPLALGDTLLLSAVRELKPVVVLDTAIRFMAGRDENSSVENSRGLATGCFQLIQAGAQSVICIHHSTKELGKETNNGKLRTMTLENVLRGTGDLGAMADAVYGLRSQNEEERRKFLITVQCPKARDFEATKAFQVQGRPYIDTIGDLAVLSDFQEQSEVERLSAAIAKDPRASYRASRVGISKTRIQAIAVKGGWTRQGRLWVRGSQETIPILRLTNASHSSRISSKALGSRSPFGRTTENLDSTGSGPHQAPAPSTRRVRQPG